MEENFFNEVCESTVFPFKDHITRYNARELVDLFFLYMLSLQILKSEFLSAPFAIDYVRKTMANEQFDNFRTSGTDLYILIHTLFGKNSESIKKSLKNQEASKLLLDKISIDLTMTKQWFRDIINNRSKEQFDQRYLLRLENDLKIDVSDYKSIRRIVSEWPTLNQQQRQLAMTRLIFALRKRAPRSEILPVIEKISKVKNLFIKGAKNPEESGMSQNTLNLMALGLLSSADEVVSHIKRSVKETEAVEENVSAGGTGVGAIAAIPMPVFTPTTVIKRTAASKKKPKKPNK